MAVFHLKASFGSRAGGQSALAKSQYIEREGHYEKDGEELEHKENENMPEWAEDDPEQYWEAADEHERANGRLYSEVQFALPKELNEDERRELASGFAGRMTEGERLPYTLAVHRGDGENPHAHLMFSERVNDGIERSREQWFRRTNRKEPEKGGARKSRAGSARDWMDKTREAWEREANEALERAGYGERIDRRSLAERRDEAYQAGDLERAAELSRKPNVHLGPQAYRTGDLEREDRGERRDEAERSGVLARAERVEQGNQALRQERDGIIERIKERIAGIYRELQALPEKIREAGRAGQGVGKGAGSGVGPWGRVREGQGREDRPDHKEILPRGGAANQQYAPLASAHTRTRARRGDEPVMAGIHQTLREARSLYAEALKLQEAVLASHRDLEGCVAQIQTWHESMEALAARVETLTVRLKNLGSGFLALVFMLCILAGLAGGFLALMIFRLAGG